MRNNILFYGKSLALLILLIYCLDLILSSVRIHKMGSDDGDKEFIYSKEDLIFVKDFQEETYLLHKNTNRAAKNKMQNYTTLLKPNLEGECKVCQDLNNIVYARKVEL